MWTLYHFRFCPRSRGVRMALAERCIAVTAVEHFPWDWHQALLEVNPSGELPVVRTADDLHLCGAYAIGEHLGELGCGAEPAGISRGVSLMPEAAADRAEVRRLVDWFHDKMQREVTAPLLEAQVVPLFKGTAQASPDVDVLRAARTNLGYHLAYVDWLADQRDWLAGRDLSLADLAAAGQISCLDYLGDIDWSHYRAAKAWYQRLKSRPSFRGLLADRVPGRPPSVYYGDLDF